MAAICCRTSNARRRLRHTNEISPFCDILNAERPVVSLLCKMSSQRMSLKVTKSAEIMSSRKPSQKVGAAVQPFNWEIWAFGSFFKAWVGRSLLQTDVVVYSVDQAKVNTST